MYTPPETADIKAANNLQTPVLDDMPAATRDPSRLVLDREEIEWAYNHKKSEFDAFEKKITYSAPRDAENAFAAFTRTMHFDLNGKLYYMEDDLAEDWRRQQGRYTIIREYQNDVKIHEAAFSKFSRSHYQRNEKGNIKQGVESFWYENGVLKRTIEYNDGVKIAATRYKEKNVLLPCAEPEKQYALAQQLENSKDIVVADPDPTMLDKIRIARNLSKIRFF